MGEKLPGEAVISALIGLAGACNNNPRTAQTDCLLLHALAGEQDVEAVRTEKFSVAPDCAVCANPCGNTSDYDMDRLYTAGAEVREAKLKIIAALREAAKGLLHTQKPNVDIFYRALLYVGSDLDIEPLRDLLAEVQAFQRNIGRNATI